MLSNPPVSGNQPEPMISLLSSLLQRSYTSGQLVFITLLHSKSEIRAFISSSSTSRRLTIPHAIRDRSLPIVEFRLFTLAASSAISLGISNTLTHFVNSSSSISSRYFSWEFKYTKQFAKGFTDNIVQHQSCFKNFNFSISAF